ncbi:restriction endonuclease subunit S [Microcystis sp. LE18-22.4A]|uniref:restriction endonuclease subunit S n=1 Tax=Microcystis sp. LE18-22.4A TaxID=3016432 RepID=UPI0025885F3E|nr:restriction endonuclease subunit S [Microcystis sp. LE18-22.4A]
MPDGWQWVKLGDVCDPTTGIYNPKLTPLNFFKYVDISSIDNTNKKITDAKTILGKDAPSRARKIIYKNDVLVATTRPNLNSVALVDSVFDQQVCSTGFCVLRADKNLDPIYLFKYVQSQYFVNNLSNLVKGSMYPAVTDSQVREQLIPLPPLSEQKRIAAILNEQMEAVEKARKATEAQLEAAKALPAAYLRAVFESEEANSWERRKLGDIAKLERGKFTPRPRNDPRYYGGDYPWIQTGEVESANKYITAYNTTLNADGLAVSKLFPKGTLVITIAATIGAVGILDFDSCMPDSLVGITPYLEASNTDFIYYSLLFIREHLKSIAPQVAQANLKLSILQPLEISLPSLAKQQQIASTLTEQMQEVERLKQNLKEQLDTINKLPAVLLRRAFKGEL